MLDAVVARFFTLLPSGMACALSLVVLFGCAVHDVSETKQPSFTLPKKPYTHYTPDGAVLAKQVSWDTLFDDATLQSLLTQAQTNNYQIQDAWLRVQKAQQAVLLARSARLLTGTLGFSAQNSSSNPQTGTSSNSNLFSLTGGVSWEADLWQKLSSQQKANVWLATASEYEAKAMSLSISGQIIDTWLAVRHATTERNLVHAHLRAQQQLYRTMLPKMLEGSINSFIFLQQRNVVLALEQDAIGLDQRIAELENNLALYTGVAPDTLPENWLPLEQQEVDDMPLVAQEALTPAMLLHNRLDVKQAFAALQAADYTIAVAIANYWPSVSLSLNTTLSGGALRSISDNITTVGLAAISSQLLNWPSLKVKEAQSRTDFKRAYAQFDNAVRTALKEVEDTLIAVRVLNQQVRLAREQFRNADLLYRQATREYHAGVLPYQDFLSYQETYLQRTTALSNYIISALRARKNLALAAGIVRPLSHPTKD